VTKGRARRGNGGIGGGWGGRGVEQVGSMGLEVVLHLWIRLLEGESK
jgi:hypothetical protein